MGNLLPINPEQHGDDSVIISDLFGVHIAGGHRNLHVRKEFVERRLRLMYGFESRRFRNAIHFFSPTSIARRQFLSGQPENGIAGISKCFAWHLQCRGFVPDRIAFPKF